MDNYKFLLENKPKLYMIKDKVKFTQTFRQMSELYFDTPEWRDLRQKVIKRANNICEKCTIYNIQNVHHLTYKRFLEERTEDLLGVCTSCHKELHKIPGARSPLPISNILKDLLPEERL